MKCRRFSRYVHRSWASVREKVSRGGRLLVIGRFAYLLHFIGSILLMTSSIVIEVLVPIYLVTNLLHLIFCTVFVIDYAVSCGFCTLETIPVFVTLIFSVYFWLVAYSYWRRLQWENNPENDD
ncbi:uncharacterized protein LOC108111336 [Drosophila eugracilis]|uniref:uncharacterized protein LOC108111336 n=1 Tax=Drosophila eugracilis TaxID=29029 RepID=UPI001BDAB956|nr:uncharacterized protein LOC108111336 [Drosophila eugracilis]